MKLTLTSDYLVAGLNAVASSAAKKGSLPILKHILLEQRPNASLLLAATNLESSALQEVPSVGSFVQGAITVPAKLLHQLVKLMPKGVLVTLERQERETLRIAWGDCTSTIRGITAADFPLVPGWTPNEDYQERDRLEKIALEERAEAARQAEKERIAAIPDRWTLLCVGARVDGQRVAHDEHFDTLDAAVIRWHEIEEERVALAIKGDYDGPFCDRIVDKAGAAVVRDAADMERAYAKITYQREEAEKLAAKPYVLHLVAYGACKALGANSLLDAARAWIEWEDAPSANATCERITENPTSTAVLASRGEVEEYLEANQPTQEQEEIQAAERSEDEPDDDSPCAPATDAPPGVPVFAFTPVQEQEEVQHASLTTVPTVYTPPGTTVTVCTETPDAERAEPIVGKIRRQLARKREAKLRFGFSQPTIEKFYRRAQQAGVPVRYALTAKHNGDLREAMPEDVDDEHFYLRYAGASLGIRKLDIKYLECVL